MSKPSRIVKSAWRRAGKPGSLKAFARGWHFSPIDRVCTDWLNNKGVGHSAGGS